MELDEAVGQMLGRLLEGGKALGTDPVPQERVAPTVKAFVKQALAKVKHRSVKPIGSTGKKAVSGDLDLGLDTDLSVDEVAAALQKAGYTVKVNKGLGEVSVEFPQHDATGTPQKEKAQVDLMIGPEAWTQWQYYGPSDKESKYKGIYVRGITNAIFQVVGGHSISPARGVFRKDDPSKAYSRDVGAVVQSINRSSSQQWTPQDFQQPFEKIWAKAKASFDPPTLEKIKEYFRGFMKSTKNTEPKELGEAVISREELPDDAQIQVSRVYDDWVKQGDVTFMRNGGRYSMRLLDRVYYWDPKNYMWLKSPLQPVHEAGDPSRGDVPGYGNVRPTVAKNNPSGAQKGQGNIGGARNRGEPGYPVPDIHSVWAVDDEGFQVQEDAAPQGGLEKLVPLAERIGVKIQYVPKTSFQAGGLASFNAPTRSIKVAEDGPEPWRTYAFAHELGHAADINTPEKVKSAQGLLRTMRSQEADWESCKEYIAMEQRAWAIGEKVLARAGIPADGRWEARKRKSLDIQKKFVRDVLNISGERPTVNEAVDPSELQKGIPHLDDLKPAEFMAFLKRYANEPLRLELSEKVDGSARISFGRGPGHIWTQSKNGTRKARSDQYPDTSMYRAIRAAHQALEAGAKQIIAAWPEGVSFFVAEVLYTRIPNSIEYGPNVIMIHGVNSEDGKTLDDATAKRLATQVTAATGGKLSDGKEQWLFEYKRTINPEDFKVDVRKEYDTLGQLYQDLAQKPRDKDLKAKFQAIQKAVKEKLIKQLRSQKSAYGPEGGDVEGIVFRDLDSGQMVKLVDKDFFTKLNEFLWHYRKMLDAGGKVGGEWKHGVMAGFRKVVADQVFGDTTAASTTFVKKLVQDYAPRVKSAKTPEQQADKTLALYIKENNLMAGEFAKDFQRSLMGAFKDFASLKREWEQFKSKPQSTSVAGKTRQFPPEHIERTDESFVAAEAALQGIKAGMEAAASIKHPMTQKVALLKLFMGHRFDKLVVALGGGAGEEEEVTEGRLKPLAAAAGLALASPTAIDNTQPAHGPPPPPPVVQKPDMFHAAAKSAGIPVALLKAVVHAESRGDASATSPKGAKGLGQLMPATAREMGVQDPHDPEQNLRGTAKYLRQLIKRFGRDDLPKVLAAYNFGPTAVSQTSPEEYPEETKAYVQKVMAKLPKDFKLRESADPFEGNIEYREMQRRADRGEKLAAGHEFPEDAEEGMELPVKLYRQKLAQHGIRVGKAIGSGVYGTAYDIGGGKVLKVTSDPDEARASQHLMGKQLKHVAQIHQVFKFPPHKDFLGYPFFGIVLEKVKVIPTGHQLDMLVTDAVRYVQDLTRAWGDPRVPSEALFQSVIRNSGNMRERAVKDVQVLKQCQIGEIRDELLANHVKFSDIHGGNIGQRADGTWVTFDLGSESVAPDAPIPVLEGSVSMRDRGPTDLSGDQRVDGQVELETVVYEGLRRLLEGQQGTIGATIGRFQPFHAGHAAIIRQLCGRYSSVLVFVAGQKVDKKNPFPHDLRLKMMKLSLPDVWTKVKVFPASIQGKGTGYVPGLVANAAASGQAEVPPEASVDVLVGEDRLVDVQKQVQHNAQHKGEPGYFTGNIAVQALPGVKNDDDADRISGTAVREALARGDKEAVRKMLDPHLASSGEFEGVYAELVAVMKKQGLIGEASAGAMGTGVGDTRTGRWGSGAWASYNPRNKGDDDPNLNAMLRSPSTRMLPMANHGYEDHEVLGFDNLNKEPKEDSDRNRPTDLGEVVTSVLQRLVEQQPKKAGKSKKKMSPEDLAAAKAATKDRVAAKNKAAAEARREQLKAVLANPEDPGHRKARDWYNGVRKKYDWPELPPLKSAVVSKLDVDKKWHEWSAEALKKPFEAKEKNIGNGELRVVEELGGPEYARKAAGEDIEHDIDVIQVKPGNTLDIKPGAYEVKEMYAVGSVFAGAKGDEAAFNLSDKLLDIGKQIVKFVGAMNGDSSVKQHFSKIAGGAGADIEHFVQRTWPSIAFGGHVTKGNLESLKKAVKAVNVYLKGIDKKAEHEKLLFQLSPEEREFARRFKNVAALVRAYQRGDIEAHGLNFSVEQIARANLESEIFRNPDMFDQEWALANMKASELFKSVNGVFITNEDKFALIPTKDLDEYIAIAEISKHQLKIGLKRPIPTGTRPEATDPAPAPTGQEPMQPALPMDIPPQQQKLPIKAGIERPGNPI